MKMKAALVMAISANLLCGFNLMALDGNHGEIEPQIMKAYDACQNEIEKAARQKKKLIKYKKYYVRHSGSRQKIRKNYEVYLRAFELNYEQVKKLGNNIGIMTKETSPEKIAEAVNTYSHNCWLFASGISSFIDYLLSGEVPSHLPKNYDVVFRSWIDEASRLGKGLF